MARLPKLQGDAGTWGAILNEYLRQAHQENGALKTNSVGTTQLQPSSVTTAALADQAVTEAKLAKTVQDKLNVSQTTLPFVSVKQFGAKGDNSADDTAAIQAAIDSLPQAGGAVYLPTGTYRITSAIRARNSLKIFGDGNSATVIFQTNTAAHGISGTDILSLAIEDLRISGPTNGTGTGIMLERVNNHATNYIHLKNLYIRTFGRDGIFMSNPIVSRLEQVVSSKNGRHGFHLLGENGVIGTSTYFDSCFADENAQSGYHINTMGYTNLTACAADHQQISYEMVNCIGMTFSGCGSEGSNTHGWKFSGGYGNTMIGGWIYRNNGIAVHITNNSIGTTVVGLSETSPNTGATACVQVDAGSKASLMNIHNDKQNNLAPGTTQIINDVAGNTAFNGALNINGPLTINNKPVRGAKWYLSNTEHADPANVTDMQDGDVFLYPGSRDLFNYNGTTKQWVYSGRLAAA